jgi:hypothetical protein
MLDVSQGICRITVRVLRVQDARCESGIWRMAVSVLKAEDARCESSIWQMTVRELNGGSQVGDRG